MADYVEAFDLFDKDGDRTINIDELKNLLRCFEQEATADELVEIIELYDEQETGSITFDSFIEIMGKLLVHDLNIDEEIKEVYKVFDRDENGINATELSRVMTAILSTKTEHKKQSDRPAGELYDDSVSGTEPD